MNLHTLSVHLRTPQYYALSGGLLSDVKTPNLKISTEIPADRFMIQKQAPLPGRQTLHFPRTA